MSAGIRAGSSNDGYVQVNGNDIITALSGGNVGIGNTSPSTKLHVNGTVTATKFIGGFDGNSNISVDDWIVHTGDTDTKLGFSGADTISFHTAGAEVVKIGSTGNLELPRNNDYIKIGSGGSLGLVHTGSFAYITNSTGFLTHRCDTHQWEKFDGSAEYFRSNATGFAIGHVAPVRRFSVKSTGENAVSMSLLDNNSTNEIWRVGQAADGDGYVEVLEDGGTVGCKLDASGNSFTMGNFGVGVASPSTALEVKGDITVYNANNQGDIFFGESGDVADSKALIRMDQLSSTAGQLEFHTEHGGTLEKRLTIASTGNVSIGTSNVTEGVLQVNGDITAKLRHGSSDMYGMLAGRKFDGNNALGGYAIRYASGYESPWIVGYNAGSSYDNQITFGSMTTADRSLATGVTKRMVIDMETGNVGINENSPSYKLQVNGSVYVDNSSLTVEKYIMRGTGDWRATNYHLSKFQTSFTNGGWFNVFKFSKTSNLQNNNYIGVFGGVVHIVYINERTNSVQTSGYCQFPFVVRGRSNTNVTGTIGSAIAHVNSVIGSAVDVRFNTVDSNRIDMQVYIYNSDGASGENQAHIWIDSGGVATQNNRAFTPAVI